MDKIKQIKIKKADGSLSDYIPIGADAQNIDFVNGKNLADKMNIIDNSIQDLHHDKLDVIREAVGEGKVTQAIATEIIANYGNYEGKIIEFLANGDAPNKTVGFGFVMTSVSNDQFLIILNTDGTVTQFNKTYYEKHNFETYSYINEISDLDNFTIDQRGDAPYMASVQNAINRPFPQETGIKGIVCVVAYAIDQQIQLYKDIETNKNYYRIITGTADRHSFSVWNRSELVDVDKDLDRKVSMYFTNLDVQEEINRKLDEMVQTGELQELLNGQYEELKDFVQVELNAQTLRINDINDKVNKSVSGSPKAVYDSLEKLKEVNPDHNYIYVTSDNGNWNYFNNTLNEWVSGGLYQGTIIANGSIDVLKLDNPLNNLIAKKLTSINVGTLNSGIYITIDGNTNTIKLNNHASWGYFKIDISKYKNLILKYMTYTFHKNYGFIITDDQDYVLYHNEGSSQYQYYIYNGYYKVESNAKYLYLQLNIQNYESQGNIEYLLNNPFLVSVIDNLYVNFDYNSKSNSNILLNKMGYWLDKTKIVTPDNKIKLSYLNENNWNTKVYKMNKYFKYSITGINIQASCAYVLVDNEFTLIEKSTDIYGSEAFTKEFIADTDGYIIVSDSKFATQKVEIYDKINIPKIDNNKIFSNIKIGFTGDSICAGDGYKGGYAKILHDDYGLNIQNIGVSGGHITHDRDDVFIISNSIKDLDINCDGYIIEGGINDWSNWVNMGELTSNYTDPVDQTTFIGALEKTFRDLYSYHAGKKFAFIIVHNANNAYVTKNKNTWKEFIDNIYIVAKKYGVDVIDITQTTAMATGIESIKNTYTSAKDGLHPNKDGYTKFYIPLLKKWIEENFK